nr:PREDICTED: uncharacterized protein LOC108199582 isoform X1 [Daucus carota subsp. sativus]
MECNKGEAFRAMRMAEKKMENKDYLRARKIANQAQKLYPELENISQLIMVCDVHCSAENKVHGTEMDWYGILKVEPTADDLLIRKQSRKFGLFLHPHKNKCPGAADAFNLIGEAQSVLLDQEKRWIHDMKCISGAVNDDPRQANGPYNVQRPPGHERSYVNANKEFQQATQTAQTGFSFSRPTFWTAWPFCSICCQCNRDVLNQSIRCQTCGKSFIGNDICNPGEASHNSWNLLAVTKQTGDHNQAPSKVDQQSNVKNFKRLKVGENIWSSEAPQGYKPNERCGDVSTHCNQKSKVEIPQLCENMNRKKRKQVSESIRCCNSESSTKSKELFAKGGGSNSEPFASRATRSERDLSLKNNTNDDVNAVEPAQGNNYQDSFQSTRVAVKDLPPQQVLPVLDYNKEEALRAKGIAEMKMENKGLQNTGNNIQIEHDKPSEENSSVNANRHFHLRSAMERTKEVAFNAKAWAEKKMEKKEFLGARNFATKAQNLYPELENISQLIMVCDVHCSAENKISGTEMDWYGILKLEPTADDVLIKKQFRKFALYLHPDENQFAGAADAFKLIGEAHRVLLDPLKRKMHDVKRKSALVNGSSKTTNRPFSDQRAPQHENSSVNANRPFQQAPQTARTGSSGEASTKSKEDVAIEGGEDYCKLGSSSSRLRSDVSYSGEAVEDLLKTQEPSGMNKSRGHDAHMEENGEEAIMKKHCFSKEVLPNKSNKTEKNSENGAPSEEAKTEPETFEYPDPDFSDFDKNREEKRFAAGQIWAVYDTLDTLPRFYTQIVKVLRPNFKLRIIWLEPDLDDNDEIKWAEEGLPIACGKFRPGSIENTENHLMFSHVVSWDKGIRRNTFKIYPKKGDTWALFKSWNINWSSDPESHRKYEYEFVEVLSNYANGTAISVAYLGKVKGYVCLFCRAKQEGVDTFEIEPTELFRFSHKIPSFRITGKDRKGIPLEFFELDPAGLPIDLLDEYEMLQSNAIEYKFDNLTEDAGVASDISEEGYEIPDPEFYNFDSNKSLEKFEIGQVWALYSDVDGLPKYYCCIKKIDRLPKYKLHVAWLDVCSTSNDIIQWNDKKIPVTCGRFQLRKLKPSEYTSPAPFSHQLRARVETRGKKEEYVILPRKGEIWALYRSWDVRMKCSDLENCEYDIVEVVEETQSGISVLSLEEVKGFKSVFRAQVKGQFPVTFMIPANELIRFSHQIPAFRLTGERGGSLRGYLELDPAAFPFHWFCKD